MPINESSLMLNPDGSIYHLNLHPGDIAETIIFVGDPSRVPLVSQHFDRIEVSKQKREFITHTGYIGNKRLSVISTGIGLGCVDIVVNELDALVNVDFNKRELKSNTTSLNIIRLGTAGGLQEDLDPDTYAVTTAALGFDGLLSFYDYTYESEEIDLLNAVHQQFQTLPTVNNAYVTRGNAELVNLFSDRCHSGITLTCLGFYGPQYRRLRARLIPQDLLNLAQQFSYHRERIVNFEMETSAIYGLGKLLGHRCCSVSALINNRVRKKISQSIDQTIEKMITFSIEKITQQPNF